MIIKRYGMQDCKLGDNPISKGNKFSVNQRPMNDFEEKQMQKILYASTIRSLIYAEICTRPDIAYVTRMLGRYLSNPRANHWKAAN